MSVRKSDPLLTAVIPISRLFGKLKNLKETLEHARGEELNFIIVHDIQDDLTGPALDALLAEFPSENLIAIQGIFGSPGLARNAGLRLVQTKWVTFWDGDDVALVRNFLEIVRVASQENLSVAVGSYAITDFNTNKVLKCKFFRADSNQNLYAIAINPGLWRFAFETKFVRNVEFKAWKLAEDQDFLIQTEFWNHRYKTFNKVVYRYSRNVQGQLTQKSRNSHELTNSVEGLLNSIKKTSIKPKDQKFLEIIALRQVISYIKFSRHLTDLFDGLKYLIILTLTLKIRVLSLSIHILFQAGTRDTPTTTTYLQGGLGNNLFQIAAAESIAQGDIRVLVWKSDFQRMEKLIRELGSHSQVETHILRNGLIRRLLNLNMRISMETRDILNKKLQPGISALLTLYFSCIFRKRTKMIFGSNVGWSTIDRNLQNTLLVGYFQSFKYSAVDNNSHFAKDLLRRIGRTEKTWQRLADVEMPLVVHVRLGDYRSEPKFGIPSPDYYSEAIKGLFATGNFEKIWLFSDEPQFARNYIPEELQSFVRVIEGGSLDALSTLGVMTFGKGYVIGNSTFGWWGSFLTINETAPVIAPSEWFSGMPNPVSILPAEWLPRNPYFGEGWKAITRGAFLWKDTNNEIK